MKKVIILIGNYGSGKTEIALNMAASEMSGIPVVHTTGRKEFLEEFLQDEGLDPDYIGIPIALETYMHRSWDNFEI